VNLLFETNGKRNLRFKDGFAFALCSAFQRFALPALGRGRRSRPARKRTRRRKMPEIAAESPASGARFVGWHGLA